MSEISFFVKGTPVPKGRPRVVHGHAFTPARTRAWEEIVGWEAKGAMRGRPMYDCPLEVHLWFYGARANGDLDNFSKSCLDAMNRVVYRDDSLVTKLVSERLPISDKGPGVQILVAERIPISK